MARQALDLLSNLNSTGISIEVDEDTGISIIHEMGAFGTAPSMPRDIAFLYLSDQIGSLLESKN